jgi:hypothetical protein
MKKAKNIAEISLHPAHMLPKASQPLEIRLSKAEPLDLRS